MFFNIFIIYIKINYLLNNFTVYLFISVTVIRYKYSIFILWGDFLKIGVLFWQNRLNENKTNINTRIFIIPEFLIYRFLG